MSKPTIVIIRNAYAHDFGGGERFPVFLGSELKEYGFDPIVISRSQKLLSFAASQNISIKKGWWWSRQSWNGWRITLIPLYCAWQVILFLWYLNTFRKIRPQIAHIQSKDDFIAATLAFMVIGVKVIWTDHADLKHVWLNVEKPLRNPVGKLVLIAAKYATAITVVSESEKQFITDQISHRTDVISKLGVIHNGVKDRYESHAVHKSKDEYVFCIASRLVTDKGIGEAIEAFSQVHQSYPQTRLLIMGDGPEAQRFKDQAKSIPSITFLGHIDQPLDVMANSHAFIHPTYHEGFSVALVEASMMALPIIASRVGGNVEIIKDGATGLLVLEKNVTELIKAMEKLLANPELGIKLGENARHQYLETFEFTAIVKKQFLPLYNRS